MKKLKNSHPAIKNLISILVGVITVTLVFVLFTPQITLIFLILVFIIALGHSILLGLPLYLLLPVQIKQHWYIAAIAGFFIGILPILFLSWDVSNTTHSYHTDADQVIDGIRTNAGWISYIQMILFAGALGIIGAMTTWIVWKKLR